jgi:thimet oligopeptidase
MSILNYSNIQVSDLEEYKKKYIQDRTLVTDTVLSIDKKDLCWSNLVQPFIELEDRHNNLAKFSMKNFYEEKTIREACTKLSTELSKWTTEQISRKDIYSLFKHYSENKYLEEKQTLTSEQNKYFENIMLDYSQNGMNLDEEAFAELQDIKQKNIQLCSDFFLNMNNESYSILMTKDDLSGLPEQYLKDHIFIDSLDESYKITLKYPDYIPFMEYSKNRVLKKELCTQFKSRCIKENTPIIDQVFKNTRPRLAELLGYKNYSDYKLVNAMASKTETVNEFLKDLLVKVKPLLHEDLKVLQSLYNELYDPSEKEDIQMWDIAYLSRVHTERTCQFKKEDLKQYFPVQTVITGALSIYQQLLGFTFTNITDQYKDTFWHNSVEMFQVNETSNDLLVGYFYLDLYPRQGKYSHAACFPFINKSIKSLPVATMACNFGEGFLEFNEVETFFHEFGHVMHHLSSDCTIDGMGAFSCERDFVETPSQMFEEWTYCAESLKLMSKDLPEDMIAKLNKSRNMLQGYHYARQLLFGIFDMTIHSQEYKNMNLSPSELFSKIQKEVLELDTIPGTSEPASFGHLMGGYAAGYYGYAWSLVYAKDLFSVFKDNKLLDRELGLRFREQVLSQGSKRKSMDSIKLFLGREPSNDAFIKSITLF